MFFLWGVANNLNDVLMPHLRKAFFLSDFQSSLVQSAFYLGYFFLALPAELGDPALRLQGHGAGAG